MSNLQDFAKSLKAVASEQVIKNFDKLLAKLAGSGDFPGLDFELDEATG
jgi:hypothetical protein